MAQVTCSFCGRNKKDVDLMVSGISAHICNFCIEQAHMILGEEEKTKKSAPSKPKFKLKKPKELTEFLGQYVIGQEDAKKSTHSSGIQPLQKATATNRPR